MKTKLVIALVAVLIFAEWIVLKRTTPVPLPKTSDVSSATAQTPARKPRLSRRLVDPSLDESLPGNARAQLLARMTNGDFPQLTDAQVEPYLQANKRNAASLLAAFGATQDAAFLKEAKEKFPHDPRVDLLAASHSESPDERRQWLDLLKQSAPDNSLGNYLSANDYFKSGQTNLAWQELAAATGKPRLEDYTRDLLQNSEEAWHMAGYSTAEARGTTASETMSTMAQYKQVAVSLRDVVASSQQAGDTASAQSALQMGLSLGQRLNDSSGPGSLTVIQDLVGMAVENMMLNRLDPSALFGTTGQTVKDELDTLKQRKDSIRELTSQANPLLQTLPDAELTTYYDRAKTFGEQSALRWLVNKYGAPQ